MGPPLFVYGTLRDADLLAVVLGHEEPGAALGSIAMAPARLPGYRVVLAAGETFPVLRADPAAAAEGLLLTGLSAEELERVDFFESVDFERRPCAPLAADTGAAVAAEVYTPTGILAVSDIPWRLDAWRAESKAAAVAAARELYSLYGRMSVEASDALWPDIRGRADRTAGAPWRLGADRTSDDVTALTRRRVADERYGRMDEVSVRFRTYGGDWSAPVVRTAARQSDAAVVLPFDPAQGALLLVEQWRIGPHLARAEKEAERPHDWSLEAVAGEIEPGRTPEETARREAQEEAGITLGRMEAVGPYFVSTGNSDSRFHLFVAEAALSAAGGFHGLAEEGEDIRALTAPLDEALSAVMRGEIDNCATAFLILWLARNAERLTALWGGGAEEAAERPLGERPLGAAQ